MKKIFTKQYQYIHKQLDEKGKIYLNSFIDFITNLVEILEDKGISEIEYEKILLERRKKH